MMLRVFRGTVNRRLNILTVSVRRGLPHTPARPNHRQPGTGRQYRCSSDNRPNLRQNKIGLTPRN